MIMGLDNPHDQLEAVPAPIRTHQKPGPTLPEPCIRPVLSAGERDWRFAVVDDISNRFRMSATTANPDPPYRSSTISPSTAVLSLVRDMAAKALKPKEAGDGAKKR